jgi:hypothetical protein
MGKVIKSPIQYSNGGISGLFQRCRWAIYAQHGGFSIIYSIEIGRICVLFVVLFYFLIESCRYFYLFIFLTGFYQYCVLVQLWILDTGIELRTRSE